MNIPFIYTSDFGQEKMNMLNEMKEEPDKICNSFTPTLEKTDVKNHVSSTSNNSEGKIFCMRVSYRN